MLVEVIHLVPYSIGKVVRITPGRQEYDSQRASKAGYEVVSSVIFSMIKEIDRAE